MFNKYLTKARTYKEEKIVSSINGVGKTGQIHAKKEKGKKNYTSN